jgi:pentatricopeptide repeat protein
VDALNACAHVAALDEAKQIDEHIMHPNSYYKSTVVVGNSLVDMYAKCRSMDHAWQVFNKLPKF